VNAPLRVAASLFGPDAERGWAGQHWNPEFVHPQPGTQSSMDTQGAVFTVQHGSHTSVWVNTIFDLAAGRMQYVAFVPDRMVSTVDVRLTSISATNTSVEVTYVRTALSSSANEDVEALGRKDQASGPEWQEAIEHWQASKKPHAP
jgi:hypothetical protein